MDSMATLLADVAFGLAFVALIFILYRIGTYHTPHGSTGHALRHGSAYTGTAAWVRVKTVQGREEFSLSEHSERAQRTDAVTDP